MAIRVEAPAFARIRKPAQQAEVAEVVNKSNLRLPSELNYFVVDEGNSFAKKLRRQVSSLNYLAGLQANLPQRGSAIETSAFVEKSITVCQPLRKSSRIVREY